jgi:hypothetical protein
MLCITVHRLVEFLSDAGSLEEHALRRTFERRTTGTAGGDELM